MQISPFKSKGITLSMSTAGTLTMPLQGLKIQGGS